MLVLTRRVGEEIVIDGTIRVVVTALKGDKVRLGISAPPSVPVDRKEVHDRRAEFEFENEKVAPSDATVSKYHDSDEEVHHGS